MAELTARAQADIDRGTYDEWKMFQLRRYQAALGSGFWFTSAAERRGAKPPADAFAGPYRFVKPWLTGEARTWFEDMGEPRYTWADWQVRERAARAEAAEAERQAAETWALDSLAYWRELNDRRGALIAEARSHGITWADITAASGLSRMQAHTLAKGATEAAEAEAEADAFRVMVDAEAERLRAAGMAESEIPF